MNEAYFVRIYNEITLDILRQQIDYQKKNHCKMLPYEIITEIRIPSSDFNFLSYSLAKPHKCYLPFTPYSLANHQGIWRCILITSGPRNILIYTSGNIYPLYASILSSENQYFINKPK